MSSGRIISSVNRRLGALEKLRDKVAVLEAQQGLLDDWQQEQRKVNSMENVHMRQSQQPSTLSS